MFEDGDRCYRAVQSRDARFDGWFVVAVRTTGIYCRPSCPARTPRREHVSFHATAAAAQRAGYRSCKRCRPDASPGSPAWNARSDVVARAMRLIADGVVDRQGVPGLARHLGYSTRQLERLLVAEVGAGPLAIARAQRAQTARVLIETTDLPITDVAFAAGFTSVRQFNDTVRAVFAASPSELRRRSRRPAAAPSPGTISLRLPVRLPFDPGGLVDHLSATAVPGCEEVVDGTYRRTLRLPGGPGVLALRPRPDHVGCQLTLADVADLPSAVARARRLLDLDADPEAVAACLGADEVLAPLVAARPGRRVVRTVDEHEVAVRVVLGQQVSTAAARTHAARLVARCGTPVEDPGGGLRHLFPTADALASLGPDRAGPHEGVLAGPASRRRTLVAVAAALADGTVDLGPGADRDGARRALAGVDGVGAWTVEVIALRALGDPDAFPATDRGVRRAASGLGLPGAPGALAARARRWRPWRAYATAHLWATLARPDGRRQPAPDHTDARSQP